MRNAPAPSAPPPAGVTRRNAKATAAPAPPKPTPGQRRRRGPSLTVISPSAFPTRRRLVSSAHGPIRHVLLWYPTHSAADRPTYQRTYGDLLAGLPSTTAVTIVAHPKVVKEITACLVQIDGRAKDVWLPTYGHAPFEELAATDAAHRRTWESLGFTVHQLGDFHLFAMRLGALHCIKKYLAR